MVQERPPWGITRRRMKCEIGFKCLLRVMLPMDTQLARNRWTGTNVASVLFLLLFLLSCCQTNPHFRDILTHSSAHLVTHTYTLLAHYSTFCSWSPTYFQLLSSSSYPFLMDTMVTTRKWGKNMESYYVGSPTDSVGTAEPHIYLIPNTSVFSRLTKEEPKNILLTRARVPEQSSPARLVKGNWP